MEQSDAAVYAKVVARAWKDTAFKRELLGNPASVMAGMGIAVPNGKIIKMVENTAEVINLVLLAPPTQAGLSDADLEKAAAKLRISLI